MLRNDNQNLNAIFVKSLDGRVYEHGDLQVRFDLSDGAKNRDLKGLDKTEFLKALGDAGCIVHEDKLLETIFKQLDTDGNGSVGLEEFKCAVRHCPKLPYLCFRDELKGMPFLVSNITKLSMVTFSYFHAQAWILTCS
jgi:hypothetical protein